MPLAWGGRSGELGISVFEDEARGYGTTGSARVRQLAPCSKCGRKARVQGETTCFDCIDPQLLEDAIADDRDEFPEVASSATSTEEKPAREEREEEVATVAKTSLHQVERGKDGKLSEPVVHGCGRTFTYAQSYVAHGKKCDGKVSTGRIAAGERTGSGSSTSPEAKKQEPVRRPRRADPPRAKRPSRKRPAVQPEKKPRRGGASRLRVEAAAVISPAAFIAALKAERAKIDAAIAAVEALA